MGIGRQHEVEGLGVQFSVLSVDRCKVKAQFRMKSKEAMKEVKADATIQAGHVGTIKCAG